MVQFTWSRYGGYEVSSRGDARFSAFYARMPDGRMPDGRSIKQHYQCDVKGYDPGGRKWWLGKGKAPLRCGIDLWAEYFALWRTWALCFAPLMRELRQAGENKGGVLSDRFATTHVNQARALSELLNEGEA